jgi:hypothetical protein
VKKVKAIILFLLVFAMVFSLGSIIPLNADINGNWYVDSSKRFIGDSGNGVLNVDVDPVNSTCGLLNSNITLNYFKYNGVSYSNVSVSGIGLDYTNINKVWIVNFSNAPTVNVNDIIEFSITYSGTQRLNGGTTTQVSGTLYFKAKRSSTSLNYGWFVWDLMQPTISLVYNNDFLTNADGTATASFTLTSNNFNISSIDKVQWVGGNNYVMGVYSWTSTKISDSSYKINVKFIKPTDGSYTLDVWATGQSAIDGSLLSMEAKSTFSVSGTSLPVASGTLVIVSPSDLYHIDLPSDGSTVSDITTNFTLVYGGNAVNDFGSDGSTSVSVVMVKSGDASKIVAYVPMSNTSWVYNSATNTSIANFSYTWLHANDVNNYDVVFHAIIQSKTGIRFVISQNTVEILLGSPASSSGNPIIDFLKHMFEDFKNWFLSVMQYLFVPNPQQMQAISLTSGGLADEMKSYLPFLDLSAYGSSSIVIAKLSLINNKVSDLTIDLNNSNLSGIFTFTRIATNTIISILLLLLIYEVLK